MHQPPPSFLIPEPAIRELDSLHSLDHLECLFVFEFRVVVRVGRGSELPIRDFWGGVKGREFKESRVYGEHEWERVVSAGGGDKGW